MKINGIIVLFLGLFTCQQPLAVDSSSKEMFNVCSFSSNAAQSVKNYSGYNNFKLNGVALSGDQEMWAAARRVMVDLEVVTPIPLVAFGLKSSDKTKNMALISSEAGVDIEDRMPGLTATMLFDSDFIKSVNEKYSPKSYDAFLLVLLHEIGHFRMMRYLSHNEFRQIPTIKRELHADFMAGWFSAYIQDVHYEGKKNLRDIGIALYSDFGDNDVNNKDHHGTPLQRSTSFAFGWEFYTVTADMVQVDEILGRNGVSKFSRLAFAEHTIIKYLFGKHVEKSNELVQKHFFGPNSVPEEVDSPFAFEKNFITHLVGLGTTANLDIESIRKKVDLSPLENANEK
ncbi:hypothetical protein EKO29_13660 [Colwellia sp. Arc7-635]|uniref:hypothetical protein n=1 Tax=Colwellia sp. Arc7-635 TaxID=2497879 RepID=UPI000F8573C3|nr:hypothetical protein [Colwellia sp. Arc7-635]AZQ84942.1 hypothetical protein EKO29_13660 [Colwellia sp. Arc7-635]